MTKKMLAGCASLALGLQLGGPTSGLAVRPRALSVSMVDPWASAGGGGLDMGVVAGVGALLGGLGVGVGVIAFAEGAGKRNEDASNQQVCVECNGAKVVTCTICEGTGVDPFAKLVAGVRTAVEEEGGETKSGSVVTIEDWDSGPKQVVMYEEILSQFPVKATTDICEACDGRGVVVCDNCQGTGIQPRFLERFSPDDFMD